MKLVVDFDQMQHEIGKLNELCDEYRQLYGKLFTKLDESAMYWKGKDQVAYVNKFNAFETDFDQLYDLLRQYTDFMDKSLQSYRACQDHAESTSRRL